MGSCFSSSKSKPLSSAGVSSGSSGGFNPKGDLAGGGKGLENATSIVVHDSSSVVLGGEMDTLRSNYKPSNDSPSRDSTKHPKQPTVVLVPHQHTLFCERKQRVCTAVGKYQELEILKVAGIDNVKHRWVWCRGKTNKTNDKQNTIIITHSESTYQYTLSREDVGHFVYVGYTDSHEKSLDFDNLQFTNAVGPILSGPPRILDFRIEGDVKVGGYARIEGQYIGGFEGKSEYWWIRITKDGKRLNINEPKAIQNPDASNLSKDDPRLYLITAEDIGCTFKAKCRPIREDGAAGEIFTSKSSNTVEA